MKSKPTTVVSIDHTQIFLCSATQSSPLRLPLTGTLISDMEIVNHEEFAKNLTAFLSSAKLKPGKAIFIFDQSMSFVKDFPGPKAPTPEQTQEFLDSVPLRSVSGKLFKFAGGFKLVAINREIFEILSKQFIAIGFTDTVLIPSFTLITLGIKNLDASSCRLLLKKSDHLLSIHSPAEDSNPPIISRHRHLLIFLSVGAILAALITAVLTLGPVFRKRPASTPARTQSRPTPSVTPTPSPQPTISRAELESYRVQVLNASGTPGLETILAQKLTFLGFKQVASAKATTTSANRTLIVFQSRVPQLVRQLVTDELSPLVASISAQESPDIQFDILITAASKN